MTPDQLARHVEHDLRGVAIHEAAHAVIARRLGLGATPLVFPSMTSDPLEEKLFIGKTCHQRGDGYQTKMIALAGIVAEACDGESDVDGMNLMDWMESDVFAISATDAAGAGKYTEGDLDHCIGLVREAWAQIETEAEQLAAQGLRLYREMQEERP